MSAPLRITMNLAAAGVLATAVLLGGLWLGDRRHRWERPRWESGSFVPMRAGPRAERGARPLWVVAVNPRCPHCVATLRRLHSAWARRAWQAELGVLIVDTPARPRSAALSALPPLPVWWDRRGIWRRRWGHRLYGELIQFDPSGRFVRTVAAEDVLRGPTLPDPGETLAPATRREGGT